ncbi:terminase small subunit [Chryseobacterium arthrosphaerae]|uniref:Terminase small subunit n=1 Tax=Chryseobacterium arthrosphaerae TaxID=651561 RepID=A0ABU7R2Y0_9FLAO
MQKKPTIKTSTTKKPPTPQKRVAKAVKLIPEKPESTPSNKKFGNQFWKFRSKHGRDKLFATPEELWTAACEYFQWVEDNPLPETKVFQHQGKVVKEVVPIMRAMTLGQLCFYLHCNEAYFRQFKKRLTNKDDGFSTVIADIENVIFTQKFQGASGNLLNANIISRDLGLADKKEVNASVSFLDYLMQSSDDENETE